MLRFLKCKSPCPHVAAYISIVSSTKLILHFLSYIFVSKYAFGCFNLAGATSGNHFSLDLLMTLPSLGSRRARNPLCPEGLLPPRFLTHPPSGAYFMWLWERPFFNKKNIISARCWARKFAGTYRLLGVWLLKRSSAYRLLTWAQRYGTKTGKSYCVCGQCFYWTNMLSSWNKFHWAYHEDQCTMDLELCWIHCGWRIFCHLYILGENIQTDILEMHALNVQT